MRDLATIPTPPARRPDLLLRPLGDRGRYVVKDVRTGAYFTVGEQEHFLLCQLDGVRSAEAIRSAFEERFGEALSDEDLDEFLALARKRRFLLDTGECAETPPGECDNRSSSSASTPVAGTTVPRPRQSLLFWRVSLFDPDRLFNRLAPRLRFFWTGTFLVISAGCILLAAGVSWANGRELVSVFSRAWRWETVLLAWLTLTVVTTLHEFAHGLTCKHYGGEVHEVGFLSLFFVPCLYCNVSDAWLFKEKSKRLWVTLAGGYWDLFLWALAVFAWRLTPTSSLPNYLAWVVLTVLGVRVFFNFNPLLKLDGYYLLSDWMEIPNLRQRSWDYVSAHLRWFLWGAPRPARQPRGRFLLGYGVASWLFSVQFLALMLWGFYRFLGESWGPIGMVLVVLVGAPLLRGMFRGLAGGEVRKMFLLRRRRTIVWLLILVGLTAALVLVEVEDRSSGPFLLRPANRAEVRAPVVGFLRTVRFDEGDAVRSGELIACLDIPDLASQREQKRAAVREAEARLRLLEVGPRPEEIREQRYRVERARSWCDLAREDLTHARKAYLEELKQLDEQVRQARFELEHAREVQKRNAKLVGQGAFGEEQAQEAAKKYQVALAQEEQACAKKREREATGTRDAEAELVRREKDLADAGATLTLLEAGTRPEEIEAARASLARLQEEVRYLEDVQGRLQVHSSVAGLIATPRLREKVNSYLREGDLICEVEDSSVLEVEITLHEEEVATVRPGQAVTLKARALPFETFSARVVRIAPAAVRPEPPAHAPSSKAELPGTVTIYCELAEPAGDLLPGMTGHARISGGRCSLGEFLGARVIRFFRTEFWW